ncbi:MAG: phage terminase large subunit [Phascolarctobacterium sp.]|nr:phage terminase large subunit [Phascolarctobacterium sp.]
MFLSTPADIAVYGGAAGGGKTYALLLELLRNINLKEFNAVVFRRNSSQIFNTGGLWDNAITMYTPLGGVGVKTPHPMIKFPSGAYIRFAHLQYDKDKNAWQGGQIALLCCEVSTPVLMADGTYKKISDIEVGDRVRTLQGVQTVTKVGIPKYKECVIATLGNGTYQLQSTNHKVLTTNGWKSFEDGDSFEAFTYGGKTQISYKHPYKDEEMTSNCGVTIQKVQLNKVGKLLVRDITVEVDNHYITECGLVNKNCFDEVTHFTSSQFWYMLSRNRSVCGIKPYVRATCNPDADSWLASFMQWWWDPETGYPIPERSGVIRYFARYDDTTYWGDTKEELLKNHPQLQEEMVKSFTFISAKLTDNKILMESDPGYLGNLLSQNEIEKERLLYGNWKIRPAVGMYFKRHQFEIVDALPCKVMSWVRAWDFAATVPNEHNPSPDATAGVLMGKLQDGRYIVADVKHERLGAGDVRKLVMNTAVLDRLKYKFVEITIPQDPGQAGKEQASSYVSMLAGFTVNVHKPTGSKITRATPYASQVQVGNVLLLKGDWNEAYLSELEGFPDANHDDQVDASSDAFNSLQKSKSWAGLIT